MAQEAFANDLDPDLESESAILESEATMVNWVPPANAFERRAPTESSDDLDDDGRSYCERLAEEGIQEAEDDQMLEADHAQWDEEKP